MLFLHQDTPQSGTLMLADVTERFKQTYTGFSCYSSHYVLLPLCLQFLERFFFFLLRGFEMVRVNAPPAQLLF